MRAVLMAVLISVALAACGGSGLSGTNTGQPATSVPTGTGRYASQYPSSFGGPFVSACSQGTGDDTICECFFHYLEAHVPYQTALKSVSLLVQRKKPSWFAGASKQCIG